MVARKHPADEPFFREWNACRGLRTAVGTAIKRSKARSAAFRDLLFPELATGSVDTGHQQGAAWVREPGDAASTITRLALPVPALLVVGSKGKGTAVAAASYALHQLGYQVGTVASPPLRWAGERVRIDGASLTDAQYREMSAIAAGALERMPQVGSWSSADVTLEGKPVPVDGYLPPSGLYTLTGIRCLLNAGVDALVIEEGLGGLSDEVSLFDYPAVAVTEIFAEHTDVLGGSLYAVARDLLGVISDATSAVVSFPRQPAVAQEILAGEAVPGDPDGVTGTNIGVGVQAALALAGPGGTTSADARSVVGGRPAVDALVAQAKAALRLPARLSRHEARGLTWYVDAAINPPGVAAALAGVRAVAGAQPVVIAGFPDTKDVDACLAELAGVLDDHVILAGAGTDYLSYENARRFADRFGPVREVPEALEVAVQRAAEATARHVSGCAEEGQGRAASVPILTVGTMSFAGQVLEAIDADVDSWWG